MEIIMTLIVLIIVFTIAFLVGAKQGTKHLVNQIKKDGGYYDMEVTSSVYPVSGPTSSLDEVPAEFLMGGDIDRALHIAGIKEAPIEKQVEWLNKRKAQTEEKSAFNDEQLMKYLDEQNEQLLIKAGIKKHNQTMGAEDLFKVMKGTKEANKISLADIATPKGYDPLAEEKKKIDAARKEAERVKKDFVKRNFEALPLSRLSVEGMSKIIELVREDIQNQVKEIEKNTPEITLDNGIGKKPKTQSDYQKEFKKKNPKQFDGVESDKPFVKTRKKRKPKSVKEWEDEFDLGGHE